MWNDNSSTGCHPTDPTITLTTTTTSKTYRNTKTNKHKHKNLEQEQQIRRCLYMQAGTHRKHPALRIRPHVLRPTSQQTFRPDFRSKSQLQHTLTMPPPQPIRIHNNNNNNNNNNKNTTYYLEFRMTTHAASLTQGLVESVRLIPPKGTASNSESSARPSHSLRTPVIDHK